MYKHTTCFIARAAVNHWDVFKKKWAIKFVHADNLKGTFKEMSVKNFKITPNFFEEVSNLRYLFELLRVNLRRMSS